MRLAYVALIGLLIAPGLNACNTTAGAGEDISATGQAIDRGATQSENALFGTHKNPDESQTDNTYRSQPDTTYRSQGNY